MKNSEITVNVKMGHTIRYIKILSRHLELLANELESVPNLYCEKCGGTLFLKEVIDKEKFSYNIKLCPNCGEHYFTDQHTKVIEEPMTLEDLEKMKNG